MDTLPHPESASSESRSPARQLADMVVQALSAPGLSLEVIRTAAVRYGHSARDLALAVDEMLAGLTPRVQRCLAGQPSARRAEILAQVQWWAIHGYYRAD